MIACDSPTPTILPDLLSDVTTAVGAGGGAGADNGLYPMIPAWAPIVGLVKYVLYCTCLSFVNINLHKDQKKNKKEITSIIEFTHNIAVASPLDTSPQPIFLILLKYITLAIETPTINTDNIRTNILYPKDSDVLDILI